MEYGQAIGQIKRKLEKFKVQLPYILSFELEGPFGGTFLQHRYRLPSNSEHEFGERALLFNVRHLRRGHRVRSAPVIKAAHYNRESTRLQGVGTVTQSIAPSKGRPSPSPNRHLFSWQIAVSRPQCSAKSRTVTRAVKRFVMEDLPVLLVKTFLLRPYVFMFLVSFLIIGRLLIGWRRTLVFLLAGWITAFLCEFSSTRIGVPFGFYYYNGSTVGQELYITNVPFMDSLSFTFLLFASYCLALVFLLPSVAGPAQRRLELVLDPNVRTSWASLLLTATFLTLIDVVIDPVALRGDRWFLGQIYGYQDPGLYFGIPLLNFAGWAVVGLTALSA